MILLKSWWIDSKIQLELFDFVIGLVKYCQTRDNKGNLEDAQPIGGWGLYGARKFWRWLSFLYCNFIIVKQSRGSLDPHDRLIYPDFCNI